MSEYIDIYDISRKSTGLVLPRKTKLKKDQFMLYVLALIEDRDGRFLITRRAMDKKWAPGSWEIPGGGVRAGETPLQAVCREVLEETGLNVTACPPEVIYSYRNEDAESGDNYFADIYRCRLDFSLCDVKVQEEEVIGVMTASLEEIRKINGESGFLHYARILEALENAG